MELDKRIKLQRKWKKFGKSLLPIITGCEGCRTYGVCIFHENWLSDVKKSFEEALK